jgi:hypothetical protein
VAAITNVGPGAVQGPQINRLACRQIGPASFELAFHVATLDPDKMLAGLNMVTRFDQQFSDCSGRRGSEG